MSVVDHGKQSVNNERPEKHRLRLMFRQIGFANVASRVVSQEESASTSGRFFSLRRFFSP